MSYTDVRGHTVPSGTDPASRQSILDLSRSIPSPVSVSSQAAATRHVAALAAEGITASEENPVFVWRSDLAALGVWDGRTWRHLAEHAAGVMTGEVDYALTPGQWAAIVPGRGASSRVVGGMQVGTAFIPPRAGLYEIGGHLLLSPGTTSTTRIDVGAAVNGASGAGPTAFTSTVFATSAQVGAAVGSIALVLRAGDIVQLRARQLVATESTRVLRGSFSLKEI